MPKNCIIFIPGYKGSRLLNQNGEVVWPNFWRSQFSNDSLGNDLPDLGIPNHFHYYNSGIVDKVSIVPRIMEYDVYGDFIYSMEKNLPQNVKFLKFDYDWRDKLENTVLKLNKFLLDLIYDGYGNFSLICHSMGGIIASYLLRYGTKECVLNNQQWWFTKHINKLFLVGVPFKGAMNSLYNILYGTRYLLNNSLLSHKAMATFSSVYYLLPFYDDAITIKNICGYLNKSIFDLEFWKDNHLGFLCDSQAKESTNLSRLNFLGECLNNAKKFNHDLHQPSNVRPHNTLKIITVSNASVPSLCKFQIDNSKYNWINELGDGSIPHCSTKLPYSFSSFDVKHKVIDAQHVKMLKSKQTLQIILDEINSHS